MEDTPHTAWPWPGVLATEGGRRLCLLLDAHGVACAEKNNARWHDVSVTARRMVGLSMEGRQTDGGSQFFNPAPTAVVSGTRQNPDRGAGCRPPPGHDSDGGLYPPASGALVLAAAG